MDLVARHNVTVAGSADGQPLVFAHGFGCDQNMWRHVAPAFETTHRVVLFDFVGAGHSSAPYDPEKYADKVPMRPSSAPWPGTPVPSR